MESTLNEQARTLRVLQRVSSALVAEQDLEKIVQLVTDAGCEISGAEFGWFFYNVADANSETRLSYTTSQASRDAFSALPIPPDLTSFEGRRPVRIDDATTNAEGAPSFGMPIRSYLAIPVSSRSGKWLGGLFYGHSEPRIFSEESEQTLIALSAQAAVAIENANLHAALQREVQALRQANISTGRLAAIVEASDDAIISKTLSGVITTWNEGARRIFGYEGHEVIGQPVTILFPDGHINEEAAIIARITRGERVDHYETQRKHKDGSLIDLSLTISPVRGEDGQIVGASKIARDISQRRRDEAALAQAAEELAESRRELEARVDQRTASLRDAVAQMEEFSYTVSHDLRAPLRSMSTRCAVLMEDFGDLLEQEPEAMESVRHLSENCARLDRMIRDILAYGRIARNELVFSPQSLDRLARDTISLYPALQPPNAEIEVGELGSVMGHEPSIVQIVSNLLINAVKFVAPGVKPVVKIWSEPAGSRLRLWIEDNGIGIDPAYQGRLFNMFERIHPNLPYEGTGVGLAIVRKAADRMGGAVGVESDGTHGSKFWVVLPTEKS
jgi:PAS domain S-box-containing protein